MKKIKINYSLPITESTNTNTISINSDKDNENKNNEKIDEDFEIIYDINQKDFEKNGEEKDIKELIINEYVDEIKISELTKNTYFLEDIDNYYIYNIKKDIMNNIFSVYFIDTFFSSHLFKKMKLYYLNKYPDVEPQTKVLNFPSRIKRFNNGLNPDNILKLNYKFFYHRINT